MYKREIKPLSSHMEDAISKTINRLEEAAGNEKRSADQKMGDTKPDNVEDDQVTPNKEDGSQKKAPARKADAKPDLQEKYKVGDTVKPQKGPHKDHPHEIIHAFGDGTYNIRPIGLSPKQTKYRLGAAKASESDLVKLQEEVKLDEGKEALIQSYLLNELRKEQKLDPIGKEDDDIDNDGDVDDSDRYLRHRRDVITKAVKKQKGKSEELKEDREKIEKQIASMQKHLDSIGGNSSAVKMKKVAMQRKIGELQNKLDSMQESTLEEKMTDDDWVHIDRAGSFFNPKKDKIIGYSKSPKDQNRAPKLKAGANAAMRIGDAKKKGFVVESVDLKERWEVEPGKYAIGSASYDDKEIVTVDKQTAAKLQAYFKKNNDGKAWRELFQGKGKGKNSVEDQKSFDAYVQRLLGEEVESVDLNERWEVPAGKHAIGSASYDDKEIVTVDKETAAKLQAYFKKNNDGKAWGELFQGKGKGKNSVEDQKSFDAYVQRLLGEEVELDEAKLSYDDFVGVGHHMWDCTYELKGKHAGVTRHTGVQTKKKNEADAKALVKKRHPNADPASITCKYKGVRTEEVKLDEAKNYVFKDGKVHISKADFQKVSKDYKNSTKGKERMMVMDPKTGSTVSAPVVFTEDAKTLTAIRPHRQGKVQYKQDNERNQKQAVKDREEKMFAEDRDIEEMLEFIEENDIDLDSLTDKELEELFDPTLKEKLLGKLAKGIFKGAKSVAKRYSTSGRADRATKRADKAEKKVKDRERLKKAKDRERRAKAKQREQKARDQERKRRVQQRKRNAQSGVKKEERIVFERKEDYTVYHKTFSSAVQHAVEMAKKRGYEVDPEDYDQKVALGPRKPSAGKTNSYILDLMKNGKPVKQKLIMQVYYDEGRYELNMYIS